MSRPAPSPVYTLRGAGGPLNTLHFSCHGGDTPLLFSGSGKGTIHLWNLNSRRAERIIEGHSGSSVIWLSTVKSTDNLISQGRDMQVRLWDLSEGRSEAVDSVWTGSVGFCQCSLLEMSSGTCLLAFAGQQTEEIKIIELPSKKTVCTLVPDAKLGMVMCVKLWQPGPGPGPLLLAGYEDGSLLLWDVTQRSKLSQAKAHPEPVMCMTFDTERLRGVSGSSEKKLSLWTLDRQNNLQVLSPRLAAPLDVRVLNAMKYFKTATAEIVDEERCLSSSSFWKTSGAKEEEAQRGFGAINQPLVTQRWQGQGPRAGLGLSLQTTTTHKHSDAGLHKHR